MKMSMLGSMRVFWLMKMAMQPSPFCDIRTIWMDDQQSATSDYEILLERNFGSVVDRSICKYPTLWDECTESESSGDNGNRWSFHFLSWSGNKERVIGHYCLIKPLPDFMKECVWEICEPYGFVVQAKAAKSKLDGSTVGVADFKDEKDARRAAAALNGVDIGDGIVLSARYISKRKRPKTLDQLGEWQQRAPVERKKQWNVERTAPSSLAVLSDQWAYFSEVHGSPPLRSLMWTLSSEQTQPAGELHQPAAPATPTLHQQIQLVLDELDKDRRVS